jgi:hypothetical protein
MIGGNLIISVPLCLCSTLILECRFIKLSLDDELTEKLLFFDYFSSKLTVFLNVYYKELFNRLTFL